MNRKISTITVLLILTALSFSLPTARFTAKPSVGRGPLMVDLDASPSKPHNSTIKGYYWDLDGDGNTDTKGKKIRHTYFELGKHNTTLTVMNNEGKDKETKRITIQKPRNGRALLVKAVEEVEGHLYLEALAGHYEDHFKCREVSVKAFVDEIQYPLSNSDDSTYCRYWKQIKMFPGRHEIKFKASYPNGTLTKTREIKIKGEKPIISIYSPENGSVRQLGSKLHIEVEAVRNGNSLEGNFKAKLEGKTIQMEGTDAGTYRGEIKLDSKGTKKIDVIYSGELWNLDKTVDIEVKEDVGGETRPWEKLDVIYPSEETKINKNESITIEAELIGSDGLPLYDKDVEYTVKKNSKKIDSGKLAQTGYLYTSPYRFKEPGEYTIQISFEDLKKELNLTIGPKKKLPPEQRLKVDLITPRSTTYSLNSELKVTAIVKKENKYLEKVNVYHIIDGKKKKPMDMTRPGEWTSMLPELSQGRHRVSVAANYSGEVTMETAPFELTSSYLEVDVKNPKPNETIQLERGKRINITARVTDQNNITRPNTLTKLIVESPTGKTSEMTMRTEDKTGKYSIDYYPDKSGTYKIKVKSQKPGYVAGSSELKTEVKISEGNNKIEETIADFNMQFLFKVALGLAILILLLAIFTKAL